jgi:hypothetical protein
MNKGRGRALAMEGKGCTVGVLIWRGGFLSPLLRWRLWFSLSSLSFFAMGGGVSSALRSLAGASGMADQVRHDGWGVAHVYTIMGGLYTF